MAHPLVHLHAAHQCISSLGRICSCRDSNRPEQTKARILRSIRYSDLRRRWPHWDGRDTLVVAELPGFNHLNSFSVTLHVH